MRPFLKICQLGVTLLEKTTTGREGIFIFLRTPFKYYVNTVLTSTDIKLIFVFLETKAEIKHFWALLEIIYCFAYEMVHA